MRLAIKFNQPYLNHCYAVKSKKNKSREEKRNLKRHENPPDRGQTPSLATLLWTHSRWWFLQQRWFSR